MSILKYDLDIMSNVNTIYKGCITDMNNLETAMNKMIEDIEDGWNSDAGKAFFEKFNDEWLVSFKQYKEVLQHMCENLDVANEKYVEITNQANALELDV